jgi:hypothetical protein
VDGEMEATNVADGLIMEVNERDEQGWLLGFWLSNWVDDV